MQTISEFRGKYRFLSNFWPIQIVFGDWVFPSAEHAYQAAKSRDPRDWSLIQRAHDASGAKRLGKTLKIRPDWDDVMKLEVMTEIVRKKFQDPKLRQKLLDTGDARLIEGNHWGDTFWGVSLRNNRGHNYLGRILMQIRDEIRNEPA